MNSRPKQKTKICMVTTSDIDYDTRILNEAMSLAKKYRVMILARQYPHPEIVASEKYRIQRVPYHRLGLYKLTIFSSLLALMGAAFKEKADIYHAHDLDGLLCATPAAILKRKILIYDSHEVWSEIFPFSNLGLLRHLFKPLERILLLKVKAGITVNQTIANFLKKKYHKRFLALYNYPTLAPAKHQGMDLRKKYAGRKLILQLGIVDEGRGLEQIIDTAKYLPRDYLILFLGKGKLERQILEMVSQNKLERKVVILPRVSPDEVVNTVRRCDLGLALTQKISLSYCYSSPNKLFQYIAAEVPILGSNFPEYKKIILKNKIGEVVDPAKPKLIARKIILMQQKTNQDKYHRYLKNLARYYNWQNQEEKFLNFYDEIKL